SPINRKRPVLRIWRNSPEFLSYSCARCGAHGFARSNDAHRLGRSVGQRVKPQQQRVAPATAETKRTKARWLWDGRQPVAGTPAETYLRKARSYGGPLPPTLGFLP